MASSVSTIVTVRIGDFSLLGGRIAWSRSYPCTATRLINSPVAAKTGAPAADWIIRSSTAIAASIPDTGPASAPARSAAAGFEGKKFPQLTIECHRTDGQTGLESSFRE